MSHRLHCPILGGAVRRRPPRARGHGHGLPGTAVDPRGRRPGPAVHPALRQDAPRPRLYQGLSAGLRENGGQYSHAAMWVILAYAKLGAGNKATELFALLNPINHGRTPEQSQRYKVEPYVVAADVYGGAPHTGRGGWTWYTRAAGWMYRAGVESILGIRREGDCLIVDPCISTEWPGFEATVRLGATQYLIRVENPEQRCRGITQARLDDAPLACDQGQARVRLDGGQHHLLLTL